MARAKADSEDFAIAARTDGGLFEYRNMRRAAYSSQNQDQVTAAAMLAGQSGE
jgi:hypothetical protein